MNKIYNGIFLALTLVMLGSSAHARKTQYGNLAITNPFGARVTVAPQVCKVSKSLTCVVCSTSGKAGILESIEISSGAIGGFVVALDTGALPSAGREPAVSGAGSQIGVQRTCEYTLATTGVSGADCGVKNYPFGRPYTRGLTLCANTNDTEVTATFRDTDIP